MAPEALQMPFSMSEIANEQDGYRIPDITFRDPKNRKLRVLTIGAGVSGIMMAYNIQKQCENVEHKVYEKNEDIGGTWLENRYPGAACDVPSHCYTFNFALNPDWPKYASGSEDIWKYLDKVCEVFDLRKYMTFNTKVIGCYWAEEAGEWTVKLRQTIPGGTTREFEEKCDLLLHGVGLLNSYKFPDIENLERFKGKVIHTAHWPKDYQKEQWKDESIAIIGSGASAIQTLPNMQPYVKHIDTYIRTPIWFISLADNNGDVKEYTEEQRHEFKTDVKALVKHAKYTEEQINGLWDLFFTESETQKGAQMTFGSRMAEFIKDKRLLEGLTPKFGIGCRRVTPGDPYMRAIQKPNVDVHFAAVDKVTEGTVIDTNGNEKKVDTIICATGFDVSYKPHFPIVGQNGVDLAEKWSVCPEGYLGLAIPDIPNFITFIGPTWPVENGSVMGPLQYVAQYAIKVIKKMQNEFIKSIAPKQGITDLFNAHTQEFMKLTVWSTDCRAWYKNNETGRVNAVFPGSSLHYCQLIEEPRYEDYNITYQNRHNPWAYLGLGFTKANRTMGKEADLSPYLSEEAIDPKWMAEVIKKGVPVADRET
ncbi:Flavin-binding monooxygenase-like protein [Venustampulla echinocandica]|uniref:Flavin-binding monooxygenase-like protein n=1 Tax=Venustampulla echinocandica TaxID=2656787 RepID=A0A370TZP3_9HELO|nr:Flavin-binding monooxygenase-like protein [Venustampulla echinocandica]RDL41003.1 Flavin-binding monooxygenase-like protein [Venustampulla echinocandica]